MDNFIVSAGAVGKTDGMALPRRCDGQSILGNCRRRTPGWCAFQSQAPADEQMESVALLDSEEEST